MSEIHAYTFPAETRKAYENLLFPLGAYQLVGNKIVTLLVSDGLCALHNASREQLTHGFDRDMFSAVHPDDVEMLAKLGLRYATREGPYDVVYRSRLYGRDEYRYVHAVSRFHGMEDGSRVAITMYTDITESRQAMEALKREFSAPASRFLDENMGPIVVVTRSDHRILYYNKAVTQMLRPAVHYDSGLTFEAFFYGVGKQSIDGLFDSADTGIQVFVEPATGRKLEANVLSCRWEEEAAFAAYFYEYAEQADDPEARQRHKRLAFNTAIYSGSYNGLAYYEKGYRGMWLWNLTQDRLVSQSGHNALVQSAGTDVSFDHLLAYVRPSVVHSSLGFTSSPLTREKLLRSFWEGTAPKNVDLTLRTQRGQIVLHADIVMLESPVDGNIFLKVTEENVTDRFETDDMIRMLVSRQYDFIAYIDIPADHCRIIDGKTENSLQKDMSVSLRAYAPALASRIGLSCGSAAQLTRKFRGICAREDNAALTYERPDGRIKSILVHQLERDGTQYFLVCSDVTKLLAKERAKETELKKARASADAANEAKSTFLSSMSHDLRTPLNGIIGFTSFALRETDPEKMRTYLTKVDASGKILLSLINDTLELSRIESGKLTLSYAPALPRRLVSEVVAILRQTAADKNIRIREEYDGASDSAYLCDSLKLQRIVLNLVSNAIKYTPDGGTVSVRTVLERQEPAGSLFCLTVADNGIGISEAFQKRIFEPFSQENRPEAALAQGTGLGLSIVKKYIDGMKGTVRVASRLGQGTTFSVTIPVTACDEMPPAQVAAQAKASDEALLAGKRVLLCEDNALNAEIAETLLKDRRLLVDTAENGKIGVERFLSSPPGYYGAVLMDLQMPVMSGQEAARAIRALARADAQTVPILALSADVFEETMREAGDAGMNDFIIKPIAPQKLFETLLRWLAAGPSAS